MNTLTAPVSVTESADVADPARFQPWARHLTSWERLAGTEFGRRDAVPIPDDCIGELDRALGNGIRIDTARSELIRAMPACAALAAELRIELFDNSGFVVLDRLPVKRYDASQNRLLAGLLGSLISPLMAQDRQGTRLYDVLDNGGADGAVRRSKTNQAQPFHTDGPWLDPAPALIGLFCIQPALSGGSSQLASLPVALLRLVEEIGDFCLDELATPVFWNRMGERQDGELPYSHLPVLDPPSPAGALRYYVDYVRTGAALAGQSVTPRLVSSIASIACSPKPRSNLLRCRRVNCSTSTMTGWCTRGVSSPTSKLESAVVTW